MQDLNAIALAARAASYALAKCDTQTKNKILTQIAADIVDSSAYILEANQKDLDNARENGIASAMLDRLALSEARIQSIADGVLDVARLPDPVGEILESSVRPNGLKIEKKRVPFGVIGIIYEARPNVTVDAAALCLKSSNAVILRGGKEAICSNTAFAQVMRASVEKCGLPADCVTVLEDTSRETATAMMRLNGKIDLMIPRGGAGLIRSVVENATVPVIETGTGNCHIYVEKNADLDMATEILLNAKTSRPSVCNAAESLLVDADIVKDYLPKAVCALQNANVEVRGCEKTRALCPQVKAASAADFYTEYNDYIISVKVVDGLDAAIAHINEHGTKHSEAIVTACPESAQRFLNEVDAAAVYVNASTRFTDGFEFGFGAEIGISTQKMHARGPMGLRELTTHKYLVCGEGQVRK